MSVSWLEAYSQSFFDFGIKLTAFANNALVLSGGADINPITYNDKIEDSSSFNFHRDYMETELHFIKI